MPTITKKPDPGSWCPLTFSHMAIKWQSCVLSSPHRIHFLINLVKYFSCLLRGYRSLLCLYSPRERPCKHEQQNFNFHISDFWQQSYTYFCFKFHTSSIFINIYSLKHNEFYYSHGLSTLLIAQRDVFFSYSSFEYKNTEKNNLCWFIICPALTKKSGISFDARLPYYHNFLWILLQSEEYLQPSIYATEAHESHCKKGSSYKRNNPRLRGQYRYG